MSDANATGEGRAPFEPVIERLSGAELAACVPALGALLRACVEGGAGVGFVLPLSSERAEGFWVGQAAALCEGEAHLLVARLNGRIVGTVMVIPARQDNGRHRAEIAKMMVHPDARRRGLARRLLAAAEDLALSLGRRLLVLDTVTGDAAERLYAALGYHKVGVIPGYAAAARGGLDATTVFYKQLT